MGGQDVLDVFGLVDAHLLLMHCRHGCSARGHDRQGLGSCSGDHIDCCGVQDASWPDVWKPIPKGLLGASPAGGLRHGGTWRAWLHADAEGIRAWPREHELLHWYNLGSAFGLVL